MQVKKGVIIISKIISWNPGEEMSKEFALNTILEIKCLLRRLYHFPDKRPYINDESFDSTMQTLDGLKEFIENNIME